MIPLYRYNELPELPPPATRSKRREILKRCIEARVALAELKQAAELIPNSAVLVNALPLLEARASSEIENIVTTTDKLFEFADIAEDRADAATKEALRYRTALYEGTKMVQRGMLTTDMAIQICSTIKGMELDIRAESGTTLKSRMTGEVIYTPPVGQQLLIEKLDNWADFMHEQPRRSTPSCAWPSSTTSSRPFTRSSTAMAEPAASSTSCSWFSTGCSTHRSSTSAATSFRTRRPITACSSVTHEQDWAAWILFILDGVEETCTWTTDKIKSIRELMEHTAQFVQTRLPKIYSWELVELLFKQPYCRIGNLVDAGIAKRQTASVYLKQLCDIGVLREVKSGRETIFVHPKYIELLTGEENVWVYYAGVETDSVDSRQLSRP